MMTFRIYCSSHPRYKGTRVPEEACVACLRVYDAVKTGSALLKQADGSKFVVRAFEEVK